MIEQMNRADYANHRKVEANTVTKWKKRGLLVTVPDPENPRGYLIDVKATDQALDRNVDQTNGRPTNASVTGDATAQESAQPSEYEVVRLDLHRARAQKIQIENAKSLGNLVRLDDYVQKIETLGRLMRERIYSVVRQNAEWLASETDVHKIRRVLLQEVDETFEQVAKEIEDMEGEEAKADEVLAAVETEEDFEEP